MSQSADASIEKPPGQPGLGTGGFRLSAEKLAPWGPVILVILGVIVFSLLKPETFGTVGNFRAIASEQAILAIAALGVTIPIICGQFDLSVAANISAVSVLTAGLMSFSSVPWELALVAGIAAGLLIGLVNGLLVAYAGVHSFIATLATSTILFGFTLWYGKGEIIFEGVSPEFASLARTKLAGFQLPALYLLLVGVALWFVLKLTPFGRYLYAIGGNRAAAEVAGVNVRRHIMYSLMASGGLVALAGVILTSRTASAQSTAGDTFLLPAFAAAFIGASTLRRGEFHVVGTIVGVYLVAVLVSGAFAMGAQNYVSPLITGVALIVAVVGSGALSRS
ncbi:MAG: ribose transport system permease protein [Thermoleophilaceae bacterium]|jgi:ribose transport system permease protein|nr:ribose transport system permease protein [Thermoleophilaceae bacterium]